MKHNIFKRTLAAGLAVLYVAAYAPTFGNTGLFDTAITASAEGEGKTWPYKNIKMLRLQAQNCSLACFFSLH